MLQTMQYARKPFYVDVAIVTEHNLNDIAKWVGGEVLTEHRNKFVSVPVDNPRTDRQSKAFPGDYVLSAVVGFKVYTPKAFKNSFEQSSDTTKIWNFDEDPAGPVVTPTESAVVFPGDKSAEARRNIARVNEAKQMDEEIGSAVEDPCD